MVTRLKSVSHNPRLRYGAAGLIVFLAVIASAFLLLRLYSGLNVLSGKRVLREKDYTAAADRFETALRFQPNDPSIWKNLGAAYRGLSARESIQKAFEWEKKAKEAFLEASRLNPRDSNAFFHLAMVEQSLERLALFATVEENREIFNADPFYEEAMRLNPNSPRIHSTMIRRLHFSGQNDKLLRAVRHLVRIHPAAIESLEKELFWSPRLSEEAKKGLKQAIAQGTSPWFANTALSSILADEEDWDGAISCYQQALTYKHMAVTASDYLYLGRLHLENRQYEGALDYFVQGLMASRGSEEYLERLYRLYKSKQALEEFDGLLVRARKSFTFTNRTDVLYARTLIDQNRLNVARRVLNELNKNRPTPEAFYWLARVEEKEKDWDAMELAIQKATVLDTDNVQYHRLFAWVLRRQKKPERAEKHERLAEQLAGERR